MGNALVERILPQKPKRLIVLSRDEWKQLEMRKRFPDNGPMRYFLGDVRDRDRLLRAFRGVDIVIHAAALKQVPALEYDPRESVLTNVIGAQNVIDAALDCGVRKALLIGTDKACQPVNTYGACKAVAERLFIQGNAYSGERGTRFAAVRYGNVVGSRGSVVPLFLEQRATGTLTITDPRMTRFWITMPQALDLIETALSRMHGGEVFVPKIPSMGVTDLAKAIAPDCEQRVTGIRPGEKLHETLINEHEAANTVDTGDMYVIQPAHPWWTVDYGGKPTLPEGFRYSSDTNQQWLTADDMRHLLGLAADTPSTVVPLRRGRRA